jgi:hypothetical protein
MARLRFVETGQQTADDAAVARHDQPGIPNLNLCGNKDATFFPDIVSDPDGVPSLGLLHMASRLPFYLLSGWLQKAYPGLDPFSRDSGHLLHTLLRIPGNPHFSATSESWPGFWLLASSWDVLYEAQWEHRLATTGPYARVRHQQYGAFVIIMFSFLLQWPTFLTLVMFTILILMYVRLAHSERDARREFGSQYDDYARLTPAFFPRRHTTVDSQVLPTAFTPER